MKINRMATAIGIIAIVAALSMSTIVIDDDSVEGASLSATDAATLKIALQTAVSGDTITISGTFSYTEPIVISKGVTMNVGGELTAQDLTLLGTLITSGNGKMSAYNAIIGETPTMFSDMTNSASINGNLVILSGGKATIYGGFDYSQTFDNIKSTIFHIGEKIYVAQVIPSADGASQKISFPYMTDMKDITLKGWYNISSPGTPVDPATMESQVVGTVSDYYGQTEPKMYTVKLSYSAGVNWAADGIAYGTSKDLSIAYGTNLSISADVISGYVGIPVIKRDGAPYSTGTQFAVTGNIVFTAELQTGTYTITINTDGGTITDQSWTSSGNNTYTKSFTSGSDLTLPTVTKNGSAFSNWSPVPPAKVGNSDAAYTAVWTPIAGFHTITINLSGGTISDSTWTPENNGRYSKSVQSGSQLILPTPARDGFTFQGWSPSPGGSVTSDSTYTATWRAVEDPGTGSNDTSSSGSGIGTLEAIAAAAILLVLFGYMVYRRGI